MAYGTQPKSLAVKATDKDSGRNGLVRYALSDPLDTFKLNASTGEIVLRKEPRPDSLYNLSISACDGGSPRRCHDAIVLINVADLRDFPPKFTSGSEEVVLSRRAPLGTILTQLSAKHAKHPVTYRLLEHSEHFQLDRFTGELILVKSLREAKTIPLVLVAETPSRNATMTVDLKFKDDDDNVEDATNEMNREAYFFVCEDAVIGQFVGQLPAGYRSAHDSVRYQLLSVDVPFAIDYGTGVILTTEVLDHERCAFYKLPIRVTTEEGESVLNGYVFIEDRNDNAPKFLEGDPSVTVDETMPVGTEIYRLRYSDEDTVNEFHFSINVSSDPLQQFSVDDNGVVSLAVPLSFGRISSYQLRIVLRDAAPTSHGHTVTTTLQVVVKQSKRQTSLALTRQHLFVSENASVGTNIGQVTLSHDRLPDMVSHYIIPSSNVHGTFAVDPVFGYVFVNKLLDREKTTVHTFTVDVSDMEGFGVASQNLTVHVLDEDDNSPLISPEQADPIVIPENAPVGTFVTRIEYTDADEVQHFRYGQNSVAVFEIMSGNDAHHFRIGVTSGCIYVNDKLDFESVTSYAMNVSVRALSGMHSKQHITVKIEVTDVNDEAPRFLDGEVLRLHVSENAGRSTPFLLKTITAVDPEQGINGVVTYSLQDDSGLFSLDAFTGALTLVGLLDYETTVLHEIVVTAFDSGHPRLWSSIKVNVVVHDENDNPPQFSFPYYRVALPEDQAVYGKEIIRVEANDADSGASGELHYSLVDADAEPFELDPLSGVIRLLAPLDFERKSRYNLKVRAEDHGEIVRLSATVNVTVELVDVNDNAPELTNTQLDAYIAPVNSGEDILYVVDATDADVSSSLKYTLSGSDRSSFSIDAHGAIRRSHEFVAKNDYSLTVTVSDEDDQSASVSLRLYLAKDNTFPNHQVDRERRSAYLLIVAASSIAEPPLTTYRPLRVMILDINDEAPVFDEPFVKLDLIENQPPQKDIVSVHATDRDPGTCGQVEYSIVDGDANGSFTINPVTGSLSTTVSLDREKVPLYRLTVAAQDKCTPSRNSMSIVEVTVKDLNDNAPKFTRLLRASVPEDAPVGTLVTKVSCEDPDEPGSQALRYSMEGHGSDNFAIDAASGDITLLAQLDRELTSQYNLRVNAFDGVWRVSTKLMIAVEDANDNAPVFALDHYDISVPSGSQFGDVLGQVMAHDVDLNQNSEVRYSLAEDSRYVRIDPVTGHSTSLANFMFDVPDAISFEVLTRDRGRPPQATSVNCTLYVLPPNNRPPAWITNRRKYAIPTGVTSFVVADLKADDQDRGMNGEVTYRVDPAVEDFWIHSTNGTLYGNLTTPAELGRTFYLTIIASDKGAPPMEASFHVSVHPSEPNEHPPVFSLNSYTFTVSEDASVGTVVGAVQATDLDTGLNGQFEYHLDSSARHPFFINATTGEITLKAVLDHEAAEAWPITVIATDYGYSSRSALTSVLINVADVNDNPPQFVPPTASIDV
ncbi:Protocadherin Fat 4 [Aphelenchoides avenae]|nr:Protocadherin Fat 4 [Aphelenchus avenae]